jgi:aryl-alcohol dehydrogenase-like predicted oxidoreductase
MSERYNILDGYATASGTKRYLDYSVKKGITPAHFRLVDGLYLSSLGMGTYLGEPSQEDDKAVEKAVYDSLKSGAINVLDTAINYRAMKAEKSIGRALANLIDDNIISRDQVFVCTKNGYITNDADYPSIDIMEYMQKMYISTDIISAKDISSGYNVMNPNYISRCIDKSLLNMKLGCIDLVYIHNSFESWYEDVSREEYMKMLAKVFEVYEKYRSSDKIRYYGMATWTCFRVDANHREYLSLEEVVRIAQSVGGDKHGFRFIQIPFNLAYSEALLLKNQSVGLEKNLSILEAAYRLKVKIFTSIPLFQRRLLKAQIPDYAGIRDPITKLLQIIRSSPSVVAPLIGHKKTEHVMENIRVASIPPLNELEFNDAIQILLNKSK